MKKKNLGFLLAMAFLLTSCLFESSETGMDSWADSKGIPSTYKVHTVTVSNLMADSAKVYLDTLPRSADSRVIWGTVSNLKHDLAMDFSFTTDSSFWSRMNSADTVLAFIQFRLLRSLYDDEYFPQDSLDIEENLDVSFSWMIESSNKSKFADSIGSMTDSVWYETLTTWDSVGSADTTFSVSLKKKDSIAYLYLPSALLEELERLNKYANVQLKLSLTNATRAYRFYGDGTSNTPLMYFKYWNAGDSSSNKIMYNPSRMADLITNEEECKECLVLHGGVFDSLVVDIPPEPILKALSDFYGDEFPVSENDEYDVRQYVILAQLTMARDDSKGSQEFGLPIQVVVGSYVDSADAVIRKMENYRLNDELVLSEGHPNLIFHEGDSLSVQLTYGLRDFINRARDGRDLKFMMRMGYPMIQVNDTTYSSYVNDDGDTVDVFLTHFDYARYDFSSILEKPMTLKIWLASKRDKEED